MSIADLVRRLSAAGAPAEAITIAVEAVQEATALLDRRRAKDRERKKADRVRGKSVDTSVDDLRTIPGQSEEVPRNVHGTSAETPRNDESEPLKNSTSTSTSTSLSIQEEVSKGEVQSTEPRARGSRLPDNWEPSAANWKFASSRGLRALDIEIEATKFRNYWTAKPGAGARKINWDRTWENWILNSKAGSKNGTTGNVIDAADRLVERIAQFEQGDDPKLFAEVRGGTGSPNVRLLPSK